MLVNNSNVRVSTGIGGSIRIIILWSGVVADIPEGWVLCNGSNGTPDLRGRFVVGAGSTYALNAKGGAETVAITDASMPAHNHTISNPSLTSSGSHTAHSYNRWPYSLGNSVYGRSGSQSATALRGNSGGEPNNVSSSTEGGHKHTFDGLTATAGSGTVHENRPPYFALCYIMKAAS